MKLTDKIFKEMNNSTYYRHNIPLFLNVNTNAARHSLTTDIFIDDVECTTGDAMIDKGMMVCNSCGNIMSIDDIKCSSCGDLRFIVRHKAR